MNKHLVLMGLLFLSQAASIQVAWADGGRLRFHEPAGPFLVTLFTSPDPLTQGRADFSVAVERPGDRGLSSEIVQDAKVTFILTPEDAPAQAGSERLVLPASQTAATSAFLQAANFMLPHAGVWKVTIMVQRGTDAGECSGEIDVQPYRITTDETAWEIAAVPIAILLFAVHQTRKARSRRDRQEAS